MTSINSKDSQRAYSEQVHAHSEQCFKEKFGISKHTLTFVTRAYATELWVGVQTIFKLMHKMQHQLILTMTVFYKTMVNHQKKDR